MNFVKLNKYNGNTTKLNIKGGVPYLSFPALDKIPWIRNGFSTRLGGVSEGYLSSMNLGFARGDFEENVMKNYGKIASAIGFCAEDIVTGQQTHTTNVRIVDRKDRGKGVFRPKDYTDVDGLITNERDIVLTTYYADCVPLYMVDTKKKVIGLSHSGWRGTVGKMGKETIQKMQECYQTNPSDVIACIGPSICQSCYEISEDVAEEFKSAFPDDIPEILMDKGKGKYQLNLWRANQLVFLEAGVLPENIFVTDVCTCCNKEVLYSHRATNGKRGALAAFLSLV